MIEAIWLTICIMGWLGVVLLILSATNIITKTLVNVWTNKESFSKKKMAKGIEKVFVFYISSVAISIAFTMLPFINQMIINYFGVILLSNENLNTLSSTAVLGVVIATVISQGKKAIEGVIALSNVSTSEEEKKEQSI